MITPVLHSGHEPFLIKAGGDTTTYGKLLERLHVVGMPPGCLQLTLGAGWDAWVINGLLAGIEAHAIVVLDGKRYCTEKMDIANIEHAHYDELRRRNHPGLVLFTSGSSGEPKAAVHDLMPILAKFRSRPGKPWRTIPLLGFDHIGGINTLFYTLANGGTLVIPTSRSVEDVCRAVEYYRVELLPTSPTFLRLLLLAEAWKDFDLRSLKLITYGTELMPEWLLKKAAEALPHVEFQQTYGSTEVGILRAKSRGRDSTWVRVGGEGYETRIVDGKLEIKAESSMLGYLNAPSPFTEDGWYMTGDRVEQDGEWIKFLGRESDIINVGGEKVFPAEVEAVIEQFPGILEASVYGAPNALLGQVVAATVRVNLPMTMQAGLIPFCRERLAKWKVPVHWKFTDEPLHTDRGKKVRR